MTVFKYILFFIIILCYSIICCGAEKNIVKTLSGSVSGKLLKSFMFNKEYYAYMGIPFAQPPVGKLRFLSPKPVVPWDHVLEAVKEQPACMQYNQNIPRKQPLGVYGVEDCLYLDVFTPKLNLKADNKYPVAIFIYNEHFRNSYNKSLNYGPDFLIEEDVIVVTISHRLGVLGFLSLEDDVLPGNAGLKDIVLALEWVNDNIKFFGGDDSRITLLGAHGGAAAVDVLLHSSSKKLFHGAIMQSDTSWSTRYFQKESRLRAHKLAEELDRVFHNSTKLIKELSDVSAHELLSKELYAVRHDYSYEEQRCITPFGPIVETIVDGLITEYPENTQIKIDIPIIIGLNSREGIDGSMQYLDEPRYLSFVEKYFNVLLPRRVNFRFDLNSDIYYEAIKEIKNFYFSKGKVSVRKPSEYIRYIGDVLNGYAMDYTVKLYANASTKPVYYYIFDYSSELNENKMNLLDMMTVKDDMWGAVTGDELCYMFYCPKLRDQYINFNKTNSEEIIVHKRLITMWTNFIKYGKPTTGNDAILREIQWTPYTFEIPTFLKIGIDLEIKENPYAERFKFWDSFLEYWSKKAVNGVISDSTKIRTEL